MIIFAVNNVTCTFQAGRMTLGRMVIDLDLASTQQLQAAHEALTNLGGSVILDESDGIMDAVLDMFWQLWEEAKYGSAKTA